MTADGFDFIGFLLKKNKTPTTTTKKQQVCNHIFTSLAFLLHFFNCSKVLSLYS